MHGATLGGAGGERERWIAVLAAAAVLAVWMDLSPLHRFHDSDSLVPVLISLQRWTPFYWEQNRFGMLVPLLAAPVRGPFHNLLVQVGLRLAAVVLSFFLLARTVVPRPYWPAVGAATLALYVAGKGLFAHCYFQMQPYPQALALALSGVVLLDEPAGSPRSRNRRARAVLAALLLGLAFWISLSLIAWLLALLWLRRVLALEPGSEVWRFWPRLWPLPGDLRAWRRFQPFALVLAGFGTSVLLSRSSAWGGTDLGAAEPSTWPSAWGALVRGSAAFLRLPLVMATAAVLCWAGWGGLVRRSPRSRLAASAGLCLLGATGAELLVLGASSWVRLNELTIRYLGCGLLAAAMALPAMGAVLLLEGRETWRRAANAAAFAVLCAAMLFRFGPPSPAAARAAFDRHVGPQAHTILAAACTHVLGSYWRVWPAVLRAKEVLWQQGATREVWGITARSRPTQDLWRPPSWKTARVAVIRDDAEAPVAWRLYRLPPLYLVLAAPGIRVYSGTACPADGVVPRCPPVLCFAASRSSGKDPLR